MDYQSSLPATCCFTKAGLAAGTTTTLSTGGTITYAIGGKMYTKTAITNGATPTTDYATGAAFNAIPVNKGSVFAIGFDHSGNVKVIQGTIEALDVNGNFINAPQFGAMGPGPSSSSPPTFNDFCPIGYITVLVGATGAAWTFGSSNLAGPPTGVTLNWQDCTTLPGRAQVS